MGLIVVFLCGLIVSCSVESVREFNRSFGNSNVNNDKPGMDIPRLTVYTGQTDTESFMIRTSLKDTFSFKGPFTVFGPSNLAWFEISPHCRQFLFLHDRALREVVLYHAVSGKLYTTQFHNEQLVPSLLPGGNIRLNIYKNNTVFTALGAVLIKSNQNATNGVVHTLNAVMSIPTGSTYIVIQTTSGFTVLRHAVKITRLVSLLNGTHPLTMFAPSDAAFSKLPEEELKYLMSNPKLMADILKYHILRGSMYTAAFDNGDKIPTYNGQSLLININSGEIEVEGVGLSLQDKSTTNGVIHIIDTVLFPPGYKSRHVVQH